MEDRARGVDAVGRVAKTDAERMAALLACLRRLQERVERPGIGFGWRTSGIHGLHVDSGELFHVVDARARSLDLASDGRRHGDPLAVDLAEILDGGVHR